MKRKVIQLSGSTLAVTLPAQWTKKFNVKKGDELEVHIRDDALRLLPLRGRKTERPTVDVSGTHPMVKRIAGALYKAGYDEAEIHYSTSEEMELVKFVIDREFIGFEITQHGKNNLVMKKVSSLQLEEFDSLLRRMFHLISHMSQEALEAVKAGEEKQLKQVALIDLDITKYADYCRRILNKHGFAIHNRTPPMYYIVEQLEKIGDIYRDICKERATNPAEGLSQEEEDLFKQVNEFFKHFQDIFYSFSLKEMGAFGRKRYELRDRFNDLLREGKHDNLLISHLLNVEECTFDMNGPLMAARL